MNYMRQCQAFPLKMVFQLGLETEKWHRNLQVLEKSCLEMREEKNIVFPIYFQSSIVMKTSFKSFLADPLQSKGLNGRQIVETQLTGC